MGAGWEGDGGRSAVREGDRRRVRRCAIVAGEGGAEVEGKEGSCAARRGRSSESSTRRVSRGRLWHEVHASAQLAWRGAALPSRARIESTAGPTYPSLQLATHSSVGTNPFLPTKGRSPADPSSSNSARLVLDDPAPDPRPGLAKLRSATVLLIDKALSRSGRLPFARSDTPSGLVRPRRDARERAGADSAEARPVSLMDERRPAWRSRRAARSRLASAMPCASVKFERSSKRLSVMVKA